MINGGESDVNDVLLPNLHFRIRLVHHLVIMSRLTEMRSNFNDLRLA
jgi:hypothetical protein